jgi:hypothetical protein
MAAINCWHYDVGHYKSDCPELTSDGEMEQRVQNLSIEDCYKGHGLLMAQDDKECALAQGLFIHRWANERMQCKILSPDHLYINTCITYTTSSPYTEILGNHKKQMHNLC